MRNKANALISTPKKIKHKRKKVKMSILKVRFARRRRLSRSALTPPQYYKVDSDGKIKRLRRECPQDNCGAGVFMSMHRASANASLR